MGCRDQPITCRGKIADRYSLKPNKRKPWQFEGLCPKCRHGGFSITAPDQGHAPLRHIWFCNCHRCKCDPAEIRAVMLASGITSECLGSYKRNGGQRSPADPIAVLRATMMDVLADPKLRTPADLRLRMLEAIEGPAPADWPGFVAFAERAGVAKSGRYEVAARWGRSATAVATTPADSVSSDCRSEAISAVRISDNRHMERTADNSRSETPTVRSVAECRESESRTTGKTDTRRPGTSARNAGSPKFGQQTPLPKPGTSQ